MRLACKTSPTDEGVSVDPPTFHDVSPERSEFTQTSTTGAADTETLSEPSNVSLLVRTWG